jgi:hypothetical protein
MLYFDSARAYHVIFSIILLIMAIKQEAAFNNNRCSLFYTAIISKQSPISQAIITRALRRCKQAERH